MIERPNAAGRRPYSTLEQLYQHERGNTIALVVVIKANAQYANRELNLDERIEIKDAEARLVNLYTEYAEYGLEKKIWEYYKLKDSDPCIDQ